MKTDYVAEAKVLKALSEPTRLQIIDILSCGELCACDILEKLSITQSTLSHHMKVLKECGLVHARKNSTWMHYSISKESFQTLERFIKTITHPKDDCICLPRHTDC